MYHSMGGPPKKRILIADDHQLVAEGVASLLAAEYQIVGTVYDGRALVTEAERLRPAIIILDVSMPELNGMEAAQQIRETLPHTRFVFVTQQTDLMYLRAAFRAGALGYVMKECAASELKTALRHALSGVTFVSPILRKKSGYLPPAQLSQRTPARLTGRQREVLQLTAEGKSAREISVKLNVSTKTVEFHKKALMDRTGFRTIAELTRYAVGSGLVAPIADPHA